MEVGFAYEIFPVLIILRGFGVSKVHFSSQLGTANKLPYLLKANFSPSVGM